MSAALAHESGLLVIELHGALSEIDPARWRAGAAETLSQKLATIRARIGALTERPWPTPEEPLKARIEELAHTLDASLPAEGATGWSSRRRWLAFRAAVVPAYERLKSSLQDDFAIHVPSLRPTNAKRTVVHMLMALLCLGILWALPEPGWALAITVPLAIWAWTTELLRRRWPWYNEKVMRVFAPIAHPHEHFRVNSATWYSTALLILSFTREPLLCAIGLAVLGLGDPAAATMGRRFGRIKLLHGRTLIGTASFFAAGLAAAIAAAYAFEPTIALPQALAMGAAGAAAGATAELLSRRVDDNLSVPLAATAAAAAVSWLVTAL